MWPVRAVCGGLPGEAEQILHFVDHVDDVVADLFEGAYDIHEVYAGLVFVMVLVYIINVGGAQLVAQIVDFTLMIVGSYYILLIGVLHVPEQEYLVGHGGFDGNEHRVYVVVYLVGELCVALALAYEYFAYAVAAVGYALYLADYAEHGCYAVLAFVGEAAFGASVEVVGYLYLHAVGYLLVFFKPRELACELLAVLLDVDDVLGHPYHPLHALGVDHYLLFGL